MKKNIIKHYLKYVFKNNPKSLSLVSYSSYDPETTFNPYSLNQFFEKKLNVYEFPSAAPELRKKEIYFIR